MVAAQPHTLAIVAIVDDWDVDDDDEQKRWSANLCTI